MTKYLLIFLAFLSLPTDATATTFISPNGLVEECRILPQIPGGEYSSDDEEEELFYCSLDFYQNSQIALCPKTWSTSPATMIYDISTSPLSQAEYEAQRSCGGEKGGHDTITKFKQSMNQSGTSGTFSPASLLYYAFSRYFDASVTVPVAVYRTMDKDAHFARVTERAHTQRMGKGEMIRAGWEWLYRAEREPSVYRPTSDLFTDDLRQIYGAFVDGGGERYGAEINGVRSGWGVPQNRDFQETPAFWALRSESPLTEAIQEGLERGLRNSKIRRDMGPSPSEFQMFIWMKELTEIVILDHIFSQQDRIGNIDYKWFIYWTDTNGKVKKQRVRTDLSRRQMDRIQYPTQMDGSPTVLVQRSQINDNDAAGKPQYQNYTRRTEMAQKIRHLDPKTYQKLFYMNEDFQAQGLLYQYLTAHFSLDERQVEMVVENTAEVLTILKNLCLEEKLRFDLDSPKPYLRGEVREVPLNCNNP